MTNPTNKGLHPVSRSSYFGQHLFQSAHMTSPCEDQLFRAISSDDAETLSRLL